jgi:hypothetical protein
MYGAPNSGIGGGMGSSGGNRGPSSYFNKNASGSNGLPTLGSGGGNNPAMGSFNKNSAIGAKRPMGSGSNYYGPVGG